MKEQYLAKIELKRDKIKNFGEYPFNIPAVRDLHELMLNPAVTFFVGENGSGKSTLMEAIAVCCGFNAEGGSRNFNFSTYRTESCLSDYLLPVRGVRRPRDGYFLRAESFYNVATNIEELDIARNYGGSLHERSHGESFFALLNHRLRGHGLYLFDEPEAALSPQRQLAMLCRIHQLVTLDSQFIIATHSPILTAYPGASIYALSEQGIQRAEYEKTDNFLLTREFLNHYKEMLSELLKDGE